ncbi:MAG: hypothetical protein J6B45_00455 [Clostridia bacterium]|nr:hypothetical protein [Clostridia bacterium]
MDYDKEFTELCTKRIIRAKMNLLVNNGFYGLLLSHIIFALDTECQTACTDGRRIWFGPEFMKDLSDDELEFVMMHEIMHIVLQHCIRGEEYDNEIYNIAADIVINSNIMHSLGDNLDAITLKKYGVSMHLTPDGNEGYNYTAEEVYDMLISAAKKKQKNSGASDKAMRGKTGGEDENGEGEVRGLVDVVEEIIQGGKRFDDHSKWEKLTEEEKREIYEEWSKRILDADTVISILESSISDGSGPPIGARRLIEQLRNGELDWRTILTDFIQTEINDYSFSPPDRRFSDGDFFLPDYNEEVEKVANVWFLIDTSGSISNKAIRAAYSEIASAIEQFNGAVQGLLSFTEVFVTDPVPFETLDDLLAIKPVGGGGNDFGEIFRYMKRNMMDNPPAYIVIITDGYDTFPKEEEAMGIPVLWLINNNDPNVKPPFGKMARIVVD